MSSDDSFPRVSEILRILDPNTYNGVPPGVLAEAAARGERLHRLCLTYLASRGGLCASPPTVAEVYEQDPMAAASYQAFRGWVHERAVYPLAIEPDLACRQEQYRGTPDAIVEYGPLHEPTLLELKFTACLLPINLVQVQAYAKLDEIKQWVKRSILLHINPLDVKLVEYTVKRNPRDWAAFMNALSVWRWRQCQ